MHNRSILVQLGTWQAEKYVQNQFWHYLEETAHGHTEVRIGIIKIDGFDHYWQ